MKNWARSGSATQDGLLVLDNETQNVAESWCRFPPSSLFYTILEQRFLWFTLMGTLRSPKHQPCQECQDGRVTGPMAQALLPGIFFSQSPQTQPIATPATLKRSPQPAGPLPVTRAIAILENRKPMQGEDKARSVWFLSTHCGKQGCGWCADQEVWSPGNLCDFTSKCESVSHSVVSNSLRPHGL